MEANYLLQWNKYVPTRREHGVMRDNIERGIRLWM